MLYADDLEFSCQHIQNSKHEQVKVLKWAMLEKNFSLRTWIAFTQHRTFWPRWADHLMLLGSFICS